MSSFVKYCFFYCLQFGCILKYNYVLSGSQYNRNGQGLTTIPFHEISEDVSQISLRNNLITDIEEFPLNTEIAYIDLTKNQLTVFPNLFNISDSLLQLLLTHNKLHTIPAERLDILVSLQILYLDHNQLTAFPDVSGPSETLITLILQYNNFPDMPSLLTIGSSLISFGVDTSVIQENCLEKLHYPRAVPLSLFILGKGETLTNVPNFSRWNVQTMFWMNVTLVCDCHMTWIKLITEAGGIVTTLYSMPCSSPQHLTGTGWSQITMEDFRCDGKTLMRICNHNVNKFTSLLMTCPYVI